MVEYDIKPNSHKYKDQQKKEAAERKIEAVVNGPVRTKKKSELRKFADTFISSDVNSVKSYMFTDVILPAIKKVISDVVSNGVDMLLYGEPRHNSKTSSSSKISYRKFYDENRFEKRYSNETSVRPRFDYDEIIFESRGDAEAVLDQMGETIETYGFVTVGDMYDMAHLNQPFTSNKYGWTGKGALRTAEVLRLRDGGYVIKLPKALPID